MSKHLTSRLNWNLEVLVFMEGGKPENLEKNSRSEERTLNKFNPYANHWNRTQVGGKCSHHFANLAQSPQRQPYLSADQVTLSGNIWPHSTFGAQRWHVCCLLRFAVLNVFPIFSLLTAARRTRPAECISTLASSLTLLV